MSKIKPLTGKVSDFSGIVLKAASRGDVRTVQHYLKKNSKWLNEEGPHGRTLLWEAVNKGRLPLVEKLLDLGANVSPLGCYYTPMLVELSALAVARLRGFDEITTLLKKRGAKDDFYAACHRGDLDAMKKFMNRSKKLLHKPSRPNENRPRAGYHPIHYAVAGGNLDAVRLLVSKGVEFVDDLELLLDWCEWSSHDAKLVKFLKAEAKKTGRKPKNATPKKRGVKAIDQPNFMGIPAIVDASRGNHNATDDPKRVQDILDRGADVNVKDYKQKTALHRAGQAGFIKITKLLLKHGADLEATDETGATPIFDAAAYGRESTVKLLIKSKANLAHTDCRGETVLFMAAKGKCEKTFAALLKVGVKPKVENNRGKTVEDFLLKNSKRFPKRQAMLKML